MTLMKKGKKKFTFSLYEKYHSISDLNIFLSFNKSKYDYYFGTEFTLNLLLKGGSPPPIPAKTKIKYCQISIDQLFE